MAHISLVETGEEDISGPLCLYNLSLFEQLQFKGVQFDLT